MNNMNNMNTKLLITAFLLVFTSLSTFSQDKEYVETKNYPGMRGIQSKRPNTNFAVNTYNSSTTVLTVKMPTITSGKVEIYRNGIKVVKATLPAGTTLNFVLRNYGKGNYTVIVSQGNTVVYNRTMIVK